MGKLRVKGTSLSKEAANIMVRKKRKLLKMTITKETKKKETRRKKRKKKLK